ncbi:MAG TPA: MBL fold metallo-hydrolase [Burkholderiales bacterium]|nr:MBL fold metallo-hydrolase [Burkholderiales bacterium]
MPEIVAVDRLDVLVLVDNLTDSLSSTPNNVITEWTGLITGGRMHIVSGGAICCAHHGLSLLITAHVGANKRTLLLDAGPEGATFQRNAGILGVDFGAIDAVVLSHGHWDHAGGLLTAIESISGHRGAGEVPCYVHPGMFAQRATQRPTGEMAVHEPVPAPALLAEAGANVINTREPQALCGGAFYLSGEIPRRTRYELGLPGHMRRAADGKSWEPDPLLMDERFVSVQVRDKGQFVFSACSHAGVINVLRHAKKVFPTVPLYGVMGGLHLSGITEKAIPKTVADMKKLGLKLLAPGHCTGWRALSAMARAFGDDVLAPSAVGKRYLI